MIIPKSKIDILIPVSNEGKLIYPLLDSLRDQVTFDFRVLLCYDHDNDSTLTAVDGYPQRKSLDLLRVKNTGTGVCDAVLSGFNAGGSRAVILMPADDTQNAAILDEMVARFDAGCDLVCPSRFIPGGCMKNCPWLKGCLVRLAAWSLYHIARLPTHDPTNGFRLFGRGVLDHFDIETRHGFAFSLELLVKCHRHRGRIEEVPAQWHERTQGKSRFRMAKWLPTYLRWFFYAFATNLLRHKPDPLTDRALHTH